MLEEYADKGFASVFVYTREAHPGENYPAHRSMMQKLAHAQAFRGRFKVERPILVDDLEGTGHHLYGLLPNMVYLISRGGKVLFRADWTDVPMVEIALRYVVESRAQRREGKRLFPYYAEFAGYRLYDIQKFMEGLEFAGPQAVEDFNRGMKRWVKQPPTPGKVTLDE